MEKLFPNEEVTKTKYFSVGQDWEVPIPAFFVIGANRPINSISEFTEEESSDFIRLLVKTRKVMLEILKIETVYFFQNEDTEHNFHLWIFPRYDWMNKFGRKIQSVRPIMEHAKENLATQEMKQKVKEAVSKMRERMNQL